MSKSSNNIKAFFEHLPSPSRASRKPDNLILPATPVSIGDGFTEPELRSKDSPNSGHWQPQHDYEDVSVGELSPGPRRVSFTARVVNLYHQNVQSKMRHSARGCLKVLVKDDSALILVCVFGQLISVVLANSAGKINLWYAESVYHLCLGDRVTIWTTHVSSASIIAAAVENTRPATLMTSIFPERDAGCHLEIEDRAATDRSTCNTPLGYVSGRPLHGLMSLKDFMDDGGAEVPNAKILVCVKVIGSVSTFTSTQGKSVSTLSIGICDESTEATLSMYGPLIPSGKSWEQLETILLISSPGRRPGHKLSIKARTLIEVDPDIGDAEWLRRWVQREKCPVNENFPADIFDVDTAAQAKLRLQFTLADLDAFVRASPSQTYTGYVSVILMRLAIVSLWRQGQLFSMECCGMPIYANASSSRCEQCGTYDIDLHINPNLIGEVADETGSISCASAQGDPRFSNFPRAVTSTKKHHSKILWTDEAWTQLLGRSPEQLAALCHQVNPAKAQSNIMLLKYLEQRLMFMRVILLVGWTGDHLGGRLAVLRVVG